MKRSLIALLFVLGFASIPLISSRAEARTNVSVNFGFSNYDSAPTYVEYRPRYRYYNRYERPYYRKKVVIVEPRHRHRHHPHDSYGYWSRR